MIYALTPGRRAAQLTGDLAVVGWCALWVYVATVVHGLVVALAEPARRLQTSAQEFGVAMTEAGSTASRVPFVGDDLQGALTRVAATGVEAGAAGARFETTVEQLALVLAIVVALAPGLGLGVPWLLWRLRFARRAAAARRFIDTESDLDLFALRALSRQPLPRLAAISDDPVAHWRAGDPAVVHALADLELRGMGLRTTVRRGAPGRPGGPGRLGGSGQPGGRSGPAGRGGPAGGQGAR